MNRILILISILFLGAKGFSQQTIKGIITSKENKPLENVKVCVDSTNECTYTDKFGNYEIMIPENSKFLRVTKDYYKVQYIDLKNNSINIQLPLLSEVDIFDLSLEDLLDTKIITASKSEESIQDAAGVISVITKEELKRFHCFSMKEVINQITSFYCVPNYFSDRTMVTVRGDMGKISSAHVLILINGRPIRENQQGGVSTDIINAFPVECIERVEFIRGSGSVLYGSDAFSGVINIITSKVDKSGVSVSSYIGSEMAQKTDFAANIKKGDFSAIMGVRYSDIGDWNTSYRYKLQTYKAT